MEWSAVAAPGDGEPGAAWPRMCKAPASVTIPAGQSYAYISVTGVGVGTTQIEATAAGSESAVINVETVAPVLRLYNVPSSQNVGQQYGSIYVNADDWRSHLSYKSVSRESN